MYDFKDFYAPARKKTEKRKTNLCGPGELVASEAASEQYDAMRSGRACERELQRSPGRKLLVLY
ncbi:MAG: hypothetical protein PVS3B1_19790 [Ktedonobacteraceae bacterium]